MTESAITLLELKSEMWYNFCRTVFVISASDIYR